MLTSPEPDRNIDELHDDEIYAAIRYLERKPPTASKKSDGLARQRHHGASTGRVLRRSTQSRASALGVSRTDA